MGDETDQGFVMRRASIIVVVVALLSTTAACSNKSDNDIPAVAPSGFVPPTALNRTDFLNILDRHFTENDINHDSILQASEVPKRHRDRIESFDTNHDGQVTFDEYEKGGLTLFDKADLNRDQVLTGEERRMALGVERGEAHQDNSQSPGNAADSTAPS